MIVNSKRKLQIDEFIDEYHELVYNSYHDLLDSNLSIKSIKEKLETLIDIDPYFFDTYISLAEIYDAEGNPSKAKNIIRKGYQLAVKRIVNHTGKYPKKLQWGWIENRHLIRMIDTWAFQLWNDGKKEEALEIFRKLLKSNPSDNIGARYSILAIRMDLKPDYELEFNSDIPGYINAFKISKWFETNAKLFPDEFDWWFKKMKEIE